jgi:tetratricopeptide (TPR) repeat protein
MKILVTFCFLLFTLSVFAQDEPQKASAAVWQVKKYDINATIADRTLSAKATLTLQNIGTTPRSRVTLRLNQAAEVISTKIGLQDGVFVKDKDEKINDASSLQRIIVNFPSVAANSTTNITVEYKLKVAENSGLQAISPISSQFLPLSFWYPTPNNWFAPNGADYAPVNLTVNGAETVLTSSAKLNSQPFFVAGSWDLVDANGISVYLPKGAGEFEKRRAGELASLTAAAKTFVEGLLGKAEASFKLVAVRRGAGFSDSGTILLDYGAFRRQKIDSNTAMIIAESVAKTWIGNAKLVKGEGYGVIREGFSRYIANEFLEKQFGKDVADNERLRQRVSYANIVRNEAPINQTTPLDSTYYVMSANKGAMIWRSIGNFLGREKLATFFSKDTLSLQDVRTLFSANYETLDYALTNPNDTNLLVGLPQVNGTETKIALRNTGGITANVNVLALTDKGEKIIEKATIQPRSFGEVLFKTTSKIIRTEIDPDKIYPQTDYSDDVAPREFTDNNPISSIKRSFDKQDFVLAEKNARTVLQSQPNFDDARTWLGRALYSQNKLKEAENELQKAIAEKFPTPNTLAWANVLLGEIAVKSEQKANAVSFFETAIKSEGDYGAILAARIGRESTKTSPVIDESIKNFFAQFDKAAVSSRKTEIESYILAGEIPKFASGVASGQPEKWQTQVLRTEKIDANYSLAETNLSVKRLGKEGIETGTAVFILAKSSNGWKLCSLEVFEVR